MAKQFWINLPVKDVKKSKEFFTKLDFSINTSQGDTENSACLLVGDKSVVVMLFNEPSFKGFVNNEITDTGKGAEVLLSIDAQSKEEVDEMARKAVEAGGKTNHRPTDMQGGMYGCVFSDIDGHRWNVLYMDMAKMG
jgi:uncharacterized protein